MMYIHPLSIGVHATRPELSSVAVTSAWGNCTVNDLSLPFVGVTLNAAPPWTSFVLNQRGARRRGGTGGVHILTNSEPTGPIDLLPDAFATRFTEVTTISSGGRHA